MYKVESQLMIGTEESDHCPWGKPCPKTDLAGEELQRGGDRLRCAHAVNDAVDPQAAAGTGGKSGSLLTAGEVVTDVSEILGPQYQSQVQPEVRQRCLAFSRVLSWLQL